jgi:hypothetical protein
LGGKGRRSRLCAVLTCDEAVTDDHDELGLGRDCPALASSR